MVEEEVADAPAGNIMRKNSAYMIFWKNILLMCVESPRWNNKRGCLDRSFLRCIRKRSQSQKIADYFRILIFISLRSNGISGLPLKRYRLINAGFECLGEQGISRPLQLQGDLKKNNE